MFRIRKEALEFILGVSRTVYPREFIGLLRGEDNLITEVIVTPSSTYGEGFATYQEHLLPIDHTIVGSVHSHPGRNPNPSQGDLHAFGKKGGVNLIVIYPFQSIEDIYAYDNKGIPVDIQPV
jgi:proteasome lid subunit RPN8/RPN11